MTWLLPALVRALRATAPRMRVIAIPVQFRNVAAALAAGNLDAAVTVADELPAGVRRRRLFKGDFVCLFDPRLARLKRRLTERDYFAHEHVIVSYNGDLRGVVEDVLQKQRRVRCSVSSFANLGALVEGTGLLATVPWIVAREIRALRPRLAVRALPFQFQGSFTELLWPAVADDDEACRYLRDQVVTIAAAAAAG